MTNQKKKNTEYQGPRHVSGPGSSEKRKKKSRAQNVFSSTVDCR